MTTTTGNSTTSRTSRRASITGWVLSGLVIAFMLFDSIIHIANTREVQDAMAELGLPDDMAPKIGVISLIITALYAIPRTAPIGAVLLTGYLGGAVLTNWRTEQPLFSTVFFAIYVGIFAWVGVYLRDGRVRALLLPDR